MAQEIKLDTRLGTIIAQARPDDNYPAIELFFEKEDSKEKELFTVVEVTADHPKAGVTSLRLLIYGDDSEVYTNDITLYEDTNPVLEQVEESISMAGYEVLDGNHDSVIVRDVQQDKDYKITVEEISG